MRRWVMLLGALWGPVYFVFFIALILESTVRNGGDPDNDLLIPFGVLMGLHLFTIVALLAVTVLFVLDVWRNPRVPQDQRTMWLLVLLFGGIIAMPIYWWLYVRAPAARPEASRGVT